MTVGAEQLWYGELRGSQQLTSSNVFIKHGDANTVGGEVLTLGLKVQAERTRPRKDRGEEREDGD